MSHIALARFSAVLTASVASTPVLLASVTSGVVASLALSDEAFACQVGYYGNTAATGTAASAGCTVAAAGYYVSTTAATSQTAATTGYYVPTTGQSSQTVASAGYYVAATGHTSQTAATAGY